MHRLLFIRVPALLVGLLLVALAGSTATADAAKSAAPRSPSWSLPILTTTQAPFADHNSLSEIVCADATDCLTGNVGESADGEIFRSADLGHTWLTARTAESTGAGPFACAPDRAKTAPFCVALSDGNVEYLTASDGATLANADTMQTADLQSAAALACPTSTLCVAVGGDSGDGVVNASDNPRGGSWNANDIDAGHPLSAISCPDTGLCAALDSGGGVVVSTDALNGSWTRTQVASGLDQISCPSDQLCVAVSSTGQAYVSTDPVAGDWVSAAVPGGRDLTGVSCPSARFCAITDHDGVVYAATNPAGGVFTEVVSLVSGLGGISCLNPDSCLVLDGDDVISAGSALSNYAEWHYSDVDGWTPLTAISCPSTGLCVALQSDGHADTSTSPLKDTGVWTVGSGDAGRTPVGLDCPATNRCYAIDSAGGLVVSFAPVKGVWKRANIDSRGTPVAISCASRSFCAMVDSAGYVLTSSDPSGGAHAWRAVRLERPFTLRHALVTLTAVTCPSTSFCLVTDGDGNVFTATQPRGTARAWKETRVWTARLKGDYSIASAECPTAGSCVLMATYAASLKPSQYDPDALGTYALSSSDPTGGQSDWRIRQIDGGYVNSNAATDDPGVSTGLSCASTHLCAMVDDLGTALTNTASPSGRWLSAAIDAKAGPDQSDGSPGLTGVSCFRGGHCLAIDGFGDRFLFSVDAGPVQPAYAVRFGD